MAHSHLVGGSNATRFIQCTESDQWIAKVPEPPTSPEAARGSALHYVMEQILGGAEGHTPESFLGVDIEFRKEPDGFDANITITQKLIDEKIVPALAWFDDELNPTEYWVEQKVSFDGQLSEAYGTGDVLYVRRDERNTVIEAGMADWKFGDNITVIADDNDQLKFYTGAALKAPWFYELTKHLDEFHVHICQPSGSDLDSVATSAVVIREELDDFEAELLSALLKRQAGKVELKKGSWCTFCPAKPICPKWRKKAVELEITLGGGHGNEPTAKARKELITERLDRLEDKELEQIYFDAREVIKWAEDVKKYINALADEGEEPKGLKRVVHQNKRTWINDRAVKRFLGKKCIKKEVYMVPAHLISVSEAEKLFTKGGLPERYYESNPKSFTIVAVDDPRPAVGKIDDMSDLSLRLGNAVNQSTKTEETKT